jgi:hypothetical protein
MNLFFDELEKFNPPIPKAKRGICEQFVNLQAPKIKGGRVWQFVQGHDLIQTLRIVLGNYSIVLSDENITAELLDLYKTGGFFSKTRVYQEVDSSPRTIWAQ